MLCILGVSMTDKDNYLRVFSKKGRTTKYAVPTIVMRNPTICPDSVNLENGSPQTSHRSGYTTKIVNTVDIRRYFIQLKKTGVDCISETPIMNSQVAVYYEKIKKARGIDSRDVSQRPIRGALLWGGLSHDGT